MAYDQGYYEAPQRPYNGRAAQPPAQAYGHPPQQQYPPVQGYGAQGQYDQYAQDEYGSSDYTNGYAQSYDNNQYQQPVKRGGGAGRGQYPPQDQGYPLQQDYYGNGRGGGREDPRSQYRHEGRGGSPYGRPPTAGGEGGGYDNRNGLSGRGYPNSNSGPPNGGGRQPPPLGRSGGSDPGSRRAIPPGQPSPQEIAWDTPFPSFPGAKKPTVSEEQRMAQQMSSMDLNDPRQQTALAGRNGPDPRNRGPPGGDPYGRPSGESQRSMPPRGYPPNQPQPGYGPSQGQRPRPGPGAGQSQGSAQDHGMPTKQNGYGPAGYDQGYSQHSASTPVSPVKDGFDPITRSMTMPNDLNKETLNGRPGYPGQVPVYGPGASLPYNGPVRRGLPRPATSNSTRPALQQTHSNSSFIAGPTGHDRPHQRNESITDFYDAYYEPDSPTHGASNHGHMPGVSSSQRRGMSMDDGHPMPQRQQVNGYPPASHTESQPDFRAQVQPQSAVYEMAGDAPPLPVGQAQQGYPDERHGPYTNPNQPQNDRGFNGAGQWNDQQQQNMVLPRQNGPAGTGPVTYDNNINGNPPVRSNTFPIPNLQAKTDALPLHPPPVRAGLIPNSVANQANNKPPPVRNYNNTSSSASTQVPSSAPSVNSAPVGPPPVTLDEIERLKVMVKNNPADQVAQLALARKWIEAADVLVPQLPDQRARAKARERYVFDAHKMLKKLVTGQNAEAMFFLADCYGRGALGLEPDNKEAFTLYQSAAKAGHPGAAYRTAVCCELGNEEGGGTRKDPLKAIQWYKRAATLGDSPAMYKMGMIQLKGLLGQHKNPREALQWLKRAAERADAENPHALHELGLLYESQQPADGSGAVIRDEVYALSLFKQAAELGYKFSQFRLGCAYEYGLFNLPIDARLSIMWYSRAAVQEEHQSELALSGWYLTGSEGVLQQSDTEAYLWARKAAMAGLAKAEYAMGYFTEVGIGAPADLEGAKRWYWRAAAQNFPKARERLEDLKRGGGKGQIRARERVSRSKIGKANEGECAVM